MVAPLPINRAFQSPAPRSGPGSLGDGGEHLRAAIDALPDPFAIHTAIRDEAGRIVDFSIDYVNHATATFNGLSARRQIGARLLELFPAMRGSALFRAFVRVVETGKPYAGNSVVYEDPAAAGGPIRSVLDIRAVKLGDGYVVSSRDMSATARAEQALAASQERVLAANAELERSASLLRAIVEGTSDHIHVKDLEGRYVLINQADADWFGRPPAELLGRSDVELLDPAEAAVVAARDRGVIESGRALSYEQEATRDGVTRHWLSTKDVVRDERGSITGSFTITREISDQKRQEAQLRQAAKLEALGQLAGGVAHDFNNILTAIRGYAELVRQNLPPVFEQDRADLAQVVAGADRAASLIRQLLAFSRLQLLSPAVIEPGAVVVGIAPMLRRLLGEHIELTVDIASERASIRVDPAQLEQVIVNLAVNARDAMPEGGRLSIEIAAAELDAEYVGRHPGALTGPHVVLVVADTGTGMDPATQAHIFEPFFTTKEPGKGTGMGLATVYGIVKQSGGSIHVYSEPGRGSTFRVSFPRVVETPGLANAEALPQPRLLTGTETILLVEDETAVRSFARRTLEALGYAVLEAANGQQAVASARDHPGPIHALVTDVTMPGMQGTELAERLASLRPGILVLFASGFSGNTAFVGRRFGPDAPYLPKPYSGAALARAVRDLLDGGA